MRFIFPKIFSIEITDDCAGNLTYRLHLRGTPLADLTVYETPPTA